MRGDAEEKPVRPMVVMYTTARLAVVGCSDVGNEAQATSQASRHGFFRSRMPYPADDEQKVDCRREFGRARADVQAL